MVMDGGEMDGVAEGSAGRGGMTGGESGRRCWRGRGPREVVDGAPHRGSSFPQPRPPAQKPWARAFTSDGALPCLGQQRRRYDRVSPSWIDVP
jgi:hypothetical protein